MEADGGWPTAHGDGDDSGYHNGIPSELSTNGNSEVSEDGTGSLSSPPFVPFPLFPFSDCGEAAMAQFPDMTDEGLNSDVEGSIHECGDGEKRTRGTDITGRGGRALGGRVPWIEGRLDRVASFLLSSHRRARQLRRRTEGEGDGRGAEGRREGGGHAAGQASKGRDMSGKRGGPTAFRGIRTSLSETDEQGRFVRSPSVHRNWVGPQAKYRPQPNRYHLYVSLACPWSCRCLMVLYLKGLDNVISISVTHPTWARTRLNDELDHHTGWVFRAQSDPPVSSPAGWGRFPCHGCIPDYVNGARTVRELYEESRDTEGKFTVPILWDKRTGTIVNNESGDIIRMLNDQFNEWAMNPNLNLFPYELGKALDQYGDWLHETLNDGVYKCGFATSQPAYEEAVEGVVGAMDHLEALLGRQRYLLGDRLTEADVRLFQTLVRFDEVYLPHFKCSRKSILGDYPNLLNYARELFQLPGVALSVNMQHVKTHYYTSHPTLNHFALIPAAPGVWGSDHFDSRPVVLEPRVVENIKGRDSRVGLIRKVYAILGIQLFLTAAVTFVFFQKPALVSFLFTKGSWVVLLSVLASLGSAIALGMRYSRVFPTNLGLLSLFTAGESVLIGLLTTRYKADAVLLAALQTGAAVTGLSLFAFRKDSKYDLTAFGSSLFAGLLILLMSGVLAFFFKIRIPEVVMGGLGALLFSAFLVYDTQRIVGRGETQLDDRDYVLGAMDLYLDITRIFLYLLRILANENGRE
ncbi:hypothetical protein NSK_006079 [Nannochloropsis salina CCMP1776]|uniref:GST C-terminal domain-containing protein n=1 Tax=Nannochloropsis salina CCMP1776 TaxID=1027361 RepID=A0A4D9CZ44_9STRA|nr:hypothetical protein NSK_006079 [Nannochloropsis salina CCMP1776]|eukprot:TFJ82655.1 hypothetical protein NSK_006079 [Nannochloropsis salina CCMP1776]